MLLTYHSPESPDPREGVSPVHEQHLVGSAGGLGLSHRGLYVESLVPDAAVLRWAVGYDWIMGTLPAGGLVH